jgi:hypothetical protein
MWERVRTRIRSVRKRMTLVREAEMHGDRSCVIAPTIRERESQLSPRALRTAGA